MNVIKAYSWTDYIFASKSKHLMTHFQELKAHLLHIGIESLNPSMACCRELWDSVSIIYKTKICWNKGGVPLVLLVVQLVFLVYSPSSSLPDYQLCVTGPCIFTRVWFVCKGVLLKKPFIYVRFCTDDM